MAEASSVSLTTTAAQLREAAKQTMRRKQAPAARPSVPMTRNGTVLSSSSQPSSVGSSATPSPVKQPPKGPRGVGTLSATNAVPLNYGDPNESSTVNEPTFSGSAKPSRPARQQQPRRLSVRASTAKGEEIFEGVMNREEGEISDEEIRAKRHQQGNSSQSEQSATTLPADLAPVDSPDPIPVAASASTSVPLGPTESTDAADASAKGAVRKPTRTRSNTTKSALVAVTTTTNTTNRSSISAGMQPPPPPATVHREPPPISPTASTPAIKPQSSTRSLRSKSKIKLPSPPSLETHSFDGLVKAGTEDSAIEISDDDDDDDGEDDMGGISPKTALLNQQVFTQLLKMGVDEDHCRPNLPMTFQQFSDAKGLILDLLGYGMTPENIADIGIDRRLLIYCLRELKIRLPANVPVDDIISFGPPLDLLPDDSNEDSGLPSHAQSPQNDDLQSEHSMEITPVDGLIVEKVSKSPSTLPPSPPLPSVKSEPSTPPVSQSQKLNPHAEPFLPAKPPPQTTTGPSLFAIALPHQQIPPLPVRESISVSLPSSLPPRPHFSYDAASSRRSTAGSSSAGTVAAFTALKIETEMEPSQPEAALLKKLEQEKRLLLRQKLLQLKREGGFPSSTSERRDSTPPPAGTGNTALDTETQHKLSIFGGRRVGSPSPMDVDEPSNPKPEPNVAVSNSIVMPKRPPVQLRATLSRALHSLESTRPSTPSDNGPKRGVKRPKADDFVEENMPAKKSARLNGATNLPPLKRSSFAIANSAIPEQHIITWIDDEGVEILPPAPWNQPKDYSAVNGARDSEAAQLAAAAMALGLPMTAEELEAARLQEEERKAQLNAKAEKLLRTQSNLKRLELKQAEKRLQTLQSTKGQSANSEEVIQAQDVIVTLKNQLESIQARLPSSNQPQVEKPGPNDPPTTESAPDVSTFDLPVTNSEPSPMQGQVTEEPEAGIESNPPVSPENGYHLAPLGPSYTDFPAEDSNMLKDDDSEIDVILDGISETMTDPDRPREGDDLDEVDAAHDFLHHGAASQSRLTKYSPPLMLPVLTAHQPSRDQLTYSRGEEDESSRTTNPMQLNTLVPSSLVDPNGVLCQFESVGGVCRDPGCQDIHFKDFEA